MAATTDRVFRWRIGGPLALLAALALASCAYFPPAEPALSPIVEAPRAAPPPAVSEPQPPRPARKPTPPAVPGPTAALPASPALPAAAATPAASVDPDHIIGLDPIAATDWLGEPRQRSEAAPATIWRYYSADCEIDVYFYLDLQNRVMRALHYEVRSNDAAERRPERCFQQLVSEHRQHDGSSTAAHRPY